MGKLLMTDITAMLDILADYQAQRDLLEINKRELLNSVKVPAEVLAAQDEANKARQAIDSRHLAAQKELTEAERELIANVVKPELPAEYIEAMSAYNAQLDDIRGQAMSRAEVAFKKTAEAKAKIDTDLQAKTAQVFADLEHRKAEIAAEFSEKAGAVDANMARLTEKIKRATIEHGASVKGKYFHAVYVKGRDGRWDTSKLLGYALAYPEILTAKEPDGEPGVSIRKV